MYRRLSAGSTITVKTAWMWLKTSRKCSTRRQNVHVPIAVLDLGGNGGELNARRK